MLFGDKSKFAVEIDPCKEEEGSQVAVVLNAWIGGKSVIPDGPSREMAGLVFPHQIEALEKCMYTLNDELLGMEPREVLAIIQESRHGRVPPNDWSDANDLARSEIGYWLHDFSSVLGDSIIDFGSLVVVAGTDNRQRVMYLPFDESKQSLEVTSEGDVFFSTIAKTLSVLVGYLSSRSQYTDELLWRHMETRRLYER